MNGEYVTVGEIGFILNPANIVDGKIELGTAFGFKTEIQSFMINPDFISSWMTAIYCAFENEVLDCDQLKFEEETMKLLLKKLNDRHNHINTMNKEDL